MLALMPSPPADVPPCVGPSVEFLDEPTGGVDLALVPSPPADVPLCVLAMVSSHPEGAR